MKTDYQKITDKLNEIGAKLHDFTTNENDETEADMQIDFWNLSGTGLIVLGYLDGRCGLYTLVGKDGDSVDKDLEYIEDIAK